MSNYNKKNKNKYLALRKDNLNNTNCQCACCHKSIIISEAQLALPYREERINKYGKYSQDIYAYRVCPQCNKEIKHKQSVSETKSEKRLKYIGLVAIIWGCVWGLCELIVVFLARKDGGTADVIGTFLGFWILLPIPIMIMAFIGVIGYVYIYEPIKSRLKPNDGIDFDEALRLNAVHWYTKY